MMHVRTTYIAMAISLQMGSLASSAMVRFPAEEVKRYYTVQILAAPIRNKQTLLALQETLRDKGHLVYYCSKRVGGRQYLRLRAGVFENRQRAAAYAQKLQAAEGFDFFIAEADVTVTAFHNRFHIVTTPSGIWLATPTTVRELYTPARGQIDIRHTAPQIAPDGTAIAFYADGRIVKVTLETGEIQTLRQATSDDQLLNSIVRWSADGRHLAYLDAAEWELPTRLWVMQADGADNRCLIGDQTGRTKVKSVRWHPDVDRIFCVVGPTHGTVSLGGDLCCIDLDGRYRTIVEADLSQGIEVLAEFRIAGGLLQYWIAHHSPAGGEPQYSSHERAVNEID